MIRQGDSSAWALIERLKFTGLGAGVGGNLFGQHLGQLYPVQIR